jgi:hypothetical protein
MSETGTNAALRESFDIEVKEQNKVKDLHRFSLIAEGILMNLSLICVHLWREPRVRQNG